MACMVCSMMTMVMPSCASRRIDGDHLLGFAVAEARQRLVEQQDARLAGERAGQLHQPQLACVVSSPARRSAILGQADAGDRFGREPRVASASGRGAHVGADHDVVGHRHARNGRMIWKVRPTPASQSWCGLRPTMLRPSSRICAGIGPEEAVEQVEDRGLAGAVGADDAEDLALRNVEARRPARP